jgi:signal transduction histidine kinase
MTRARILIAEDEALIAEELRERVGCMGHTVVAVVATGEEAVARAEDSAADLVLMDIRLQGTIDGVDAAAAIRHRLHLPVVFLTAHSDEPTVDRAKRTEPLGYLLKPFVASELRVTIEIALHKDAMDRLARTFLHTQKLESLGVIAGGVAHNFNNLLVPILSNASLAALDVEPDSPPAQHLASISEAAERTAHLCRQMLAYSGHGTFEIGPLDISRVILDIEDLLRLSVAKSVILAFDLDHELPRVDADRSQIQQALMNLVMNGSEAIEGTGTILVRTSGLTVLPDNTKVSSRLAPGAYVVIAVTDTGSGMDEMTRERVFEPFFTTKFQGRGLGLAAAQGIARGHHGDITVHSAPGCGSTFQVYLPAHE